MPFNPEIEAYFAAKNKRRQARAAFLSKCGRGACKVVEHVPHVFAFILFVAAVGVLCVAVGSGVEYQIKVKPEIAALKEQVADLQQRIEFQRPVNYTSIPVTVTTASAIPDDLQPAKFFSDVTDPEVQKWLKLQTISRLPDGKYRQSTSFGQHWDHDNLMSAYNGALNHARGMAALKLP